MTEDDSKTRNKSRFPVVWRSWWNGIKYYFGGLYDRADSHHIFLMAGGLSFALFLCVIPMTLIIFAVVGQVLETESIRDKIQSWLEQAIPYPEYADYVKNLVFERVEEFRVYKKLAGIVGFVGLIFASSGLFSAMRTVLNQVFHVRTTQTVIVAKLRDMGLVLLVLLYFLLSTTIFPLLQVVINLAREVELLSFLNKGIFDDLLSQGISFAVMFVAFFMLYLLVPQRKQPRLIIVTSAFWAALLWMIAKYIFGIYITNMANLSRVYGAYAFLIIVAFWIYYISIVFILSSIIGQLRWEKIKHAKK